jgi:selenium-binding protein 1
MTRPIINRTALVAFSVVLTLGCILSLAAIKAYSNRTTQNTVQERTDRDDNDRDDRDQGDENYLFVWAGDQARTNPDFLAVINFNERSRHYGKVITTVPLPEPGASGNEPHHVGLSHDGKILALDCSGSKGQRDLFFDVSNPRAPHLSVSRSTVVAITDEFYPLSNGGFLVTMMGGAGGMHPGRVAEFNKDLQLVSEHPQTPPMDGFNPHGISVRPEINLMVTSDFICPSTTLHVMPGGLDIRGSVRVWNFRERKILKTISVPNAAGTIDVKLIPDDERARAYTAGMIDDKLYLVDTRAGTMNPVFDFSTIAPGGWPQLMRMTRDGKRLFVSMNAAGKVVMFDTANPARPRVLKVLDLGAPSGPHYIALTKDESRLLFRLLPE